MSSNSEAAWLGTRSGLSDRSPANTIGKGSIGLTCVPRLNNAAALVFAQSCFSTGCDPKNRSCL